MNQPAQQFRPEDPWGDEQHEAVTPRGRAVQRACRKIFGTFDDWLHEFEAGNQAPPIRKNIEDLLVALQFPDRKNFFLMQHPEIDDKIFILNDIELQDLHAGISRKLAGCLSW